VLFAILMSCGLVIVRLAVPDHPGHAGIWLTDPSRRRAVQAAVNLVPFAGISFLWLIGVLRNRLGDSEDRFFASVFLGSGLLFVASLFASAAFAGVLASAIDRRGDVLNGDAYYLTLDLAGSFLNVFAIKMAGVFLVSTSSIALRTGILARWISLAGYGCAAVLLVAITSWPWIALLFPLWILTMSIYILVAESRR
jgi:hypothetical protein